MTSLYQRSILRTLDDRLTSVVGALVAAVEIDAAGDVLLARRPSDPAYGRVFSGRYWQILDDDGSADGGEVLAVSRSLWDEVLVPGNALLDQILRHALQLLLQALLHPQAIACSISPDILGCFAGRPRRHEC